MTTITIKIDEQHKKIVQDLARSEYLTVSSLLRKLALDYAKSKQEALIPNHDSHQE